MNVNEKKQVLLAAGDGAPGRILYNLGKFFLQPNNIKFNWLPQPDSVLESILCNANESFLPCNSQNIETAVAVSSLVVTGSSSRFCESENDATNEAFANKIPVIRIMDYPMSGNACLDAVIACWCHYGQPPFTISALNESHKKAILNHYHKMDEQHIKVIGSPLHYDLEKLMLEDPRILRQNLLARQGLQDEFTVGLFVSGNNPVELHEFLEQASEIIFHLKSTKNNVAVLLNFHDELRDLNRSIYKYLWLQKGLIINENFSHDEIIASSDMVITSPFSTTGLRTLSMGKPLLYIITPAMINSLATIHDNEFPFLPELINQSACFYTSKDCISDKIKSLLSMEERYIRLRRAVEDDILYPCGAMEKLFTMVKQGFFVETMC